jgi:hypothetical protein
MYHSGCSTAENNAAMVTDMLHRYQAHSKYYDLFSDWSNVANIEGISGISAHARIRKLKPNNHKLIPAAMRALQLTMRSGNAGFTVNTIAHHNIVHEARNRFRIYCRTLADQPTPCPWCSWEDVREFANDFDFLSADRRIVQPSKHFHTRGIRGMLGASSHGPRQLSWANDRGSRPGISQATHRKVKTKVADDDSDQDNDDEIGSGAAKRQSPSTPNPVSIARAASSLPLTGVIDDTFFDETYTANTPVSPASAGGVRSGAIAHARERSVNQSPLLRIAATPAQAFAKLRARQPVGSHSQRSRKRLQNDPEDLDSILAASVNRRENSFSPEIDFTTPEDSDPDIEGEELEDVLAPSMFSPWKTAQTSVGGSFAKKRARGNIPHDSQAPKRYRATESAIAHLPVTLRVPQKHFSSSDGQLQESVSAPSDVFDFTSDNDDIR